MGQQISRRSFIKGGLAAAAGVAASGIPGSKAVAKPDETRQLATLLDISKCVGCGECVAACSEANAAKYPDPQKPFPKMYPPRAKVSDWSDKQDVDDRLTPYNWLYIQNASVEVNGEETELTIPRRCMHCVNPPCVKLCPWGAAKQQCFELINSELSEARLVYEELLADPAQIETRLLEGAERARGIAAPFIQELRDAVGIRPLA